MSSKAKSPAGKAAAGKAAPASAAAKKVIEPKSFLKKQERDAKLKVEAEAAAAKFAKVCYIHV
jgi:hypothetical protein